MGKKIEMIMVKKGIRCMVELLEKEAPQTCKALLEFLPREMDFTNGQASGAEALTYLDPPNIFRVGPENLERNILPGDVAYYYAAGPVGPRSSYAGTSTTDYAEIIYFYDRKAKSSGVNLVGLMTEGKEEFCAASQAIRPEGPIRILMRELKK
ncbi:MAG: DUF3830 family protein [Chloroflexota bacterium]|nr:DUF3830 family protein [Chloroflexota bacterium]